MAWPEGDEGSNACVDNSPLPPPFFLLCAVWGTTGWTQKCYALATPRKPYQAISCSHSDTFALDLVDDANHRTYLFPPPGLPTPPSIDVQSHLLAVPSVRIVMELVAYSYEPAQIKDLELDFLRVSRPADQP